MLNRDFAVYAVHSAYWSSFGVTQAALARRDRGARGATSDAPTATSAEDAPHSRALLFFHMVAFGVMYFGMGQALFADQVPLWFAGQQFVGTAVIAAGAFLMSWSLVFFQSWRFRAAVEAGHKLATGGPFHWLRHPIYMGLNLLALGTAIWVPTTIVWAGFVLMVIGSDLRGRAEERLLTGVFGEEYLRYCATTRRFVPGVY
jgi:protein-S-isoprenylcysteine O-methyltransferase Ste14